MPPAIARNVESAAGANPLSLWGRAGVRAYLDGRQDLRTAEGRRLKKVRAGLDATLRPTRGRSAGGRAAPLESVPHHRRLGIEEQAHDDHLVGLVVQDPAQDLHPLGEATVERGPA